MNANPETSDQSAVLYMLRDQKVSRNAQGDLQQVPSAPEVSQRQSVLEGQINAVLTPFTTEEKKIEEVRKGFVAFVQQEIGLADVLEDLDQGKREAETLKGLDSSSERSEKELNIRLKQLEQEHNRALMALYQKGKEDREKAVREAVTDLAMALQIKAELTSQQEQDLRQRKALESHLSGASQALAQFLKTSQPADSSGEKSPAQIRLEGNERRTAALQAPLENLLQRLSEKSSQQALEALSEGKDVQITIEKVLTSDQELLEAAANLGHTQQQQQALDEVINRLSQDLTALEEAEAKRQQKLDALENAITKNREILSQAAGEWNELAGTLDRLMSTRERIQSLYSDVEQNTAPYQVLEFNLEAFNNLAEELQGFNTAVHGFLTTRLQEVKEHIQKLAQTFLQTIDFSIPELSSQEEAFKKASEILKSRKLDTALLVKNPKKAVEQFLGYDEQSGSSDVSRLFGHLVQVITAFQSEAVKNLGEEERETFQSNMSLNAYQQIAQFKQALEGKITEYQSWFDAQVSELMKNGQRREERLFQADQEAKILAQLSGVGAAVVEKALLPLLQLVLSQSDLANVTTLSSGKSVQVSVDRIGAEEQTFMLAKTPKNQWTMNGQPAHLALLADGGMFPMLKDLVRSVCSGEVEAQQWSFKVQ